MARTPLFSIPCNGNSPAFPQTAASAPPWTARAYTAAPRKGRRTGRLEPFRYRRRKRFPANPPCPGPRRRPGRSCGARAPCGRWTELFLLCSCPYCRLRLFPGQDPLSGRPFGGRETVSPGIPRRRRSLSGKPPAGFQARSQFLKGNGSIQTEAHPVFLIHMVGRKTAAIIRKNPGLTGTNPQVQNLHPFLGTARCALPRSQQVFDRYLLRRRAGCPGKSEGYPYAGAAFGPAPAGVPAATTVPERPCMRPPRPQPRFGRRWDGGAVGVGEAVSVLRGK